MSLIVRDPSVELAVNEIFRSRRDVVSVRDKAKSLIKFGRNDNVDQDDFATIMQFQDGAIEEVLVSTNKIDRVVTDDASFTGTVRLEGHTIDGEGNLTFVEQDITLNGQTPVAIPTPLARATFAFISSPTGLSDASDRIFFYEDSVVVGGVPTSLPEIHMLIEGTFNQAQKAQTALSQEDYFIITTLYGGILRRQSAVVDIALQVKPVLSDVWLTVFDLPVNSNGGPSLVVPAPPAYFVPPNHDVRLVARSTSNNTEVVGGVAGYIAKVEEAAYEVP